MDFILHIQIAIDAVNSLVMIWLMLVSNVALIGDQIFRKTALRILIKLGQKLEGVKQGTVTGPDFPKKFLLINYAQKRVFCII